MFTSTSNRGLKAALAAATVLALGGCAVGPDFKRPAPPKTDQFGPAQAAATLDPRLAFGQATDPQWWRLFGSKDLDALVEDGLAHSPTLASAQAALRQSKDQLRAGSGIFFPQVDVAASPERELISPARQGLPGKGTTFSLYTLSGTVNYALDLFGGERRAVEGLKAEADRQRYAVGSAYLALTGAIADTAITRAAYDAEASTLADIVRLDGGQAEVLHIQAKAGVAPLAAALEADQQLAADREALAAVVERREAADHLLSALVGREPGEAKTPTIGLDALAPPAQIPVSLPSRLVQDRPDIRAAEAALHAASAEIGVATAALFPSITLTGTSGLNGAAFSNLTAGQNRFWSYGAELDAPIFHGGQLWFQRRGAVEGYHKALADYRQIVLAALQQTADGLSALRADSEADAAARSSLDAAGLASKLAQDNAQAGVVDDYDAASQAIGADRARLVAIATKAQLLQDVAALYLASGGGWRGQGTEDAAK
jgi:NodT family efflux transporter outer membrane factor (OMF) lipoprotein